MLFLLKFPIRMKLNVLNAAIREERHHLTQILVRCIQLRNHGKYNRDFSLIDSVG